jgi:hypothetical protein
MQPYKGYWFGLLKYYQNQSGKQPYDIAYSQKHFAITAYPHDYGYKGKKTFLMSETGIIYSKDLGKGQYIDTYPGPDPTMHGWKEEGD